MAVQNKLVSIFFLIALFGVALVTPNHDKSASSGEKPSKNGTESALTRLKRQSASDGGGSTQVTGLRLKRETSERDVRDLNVAVNSNPPGRGKRSLSYQFNLEKNFNFGYRPRPKFSYGYTYNHDLPGVISSYHHQNHDTSSYTIPTYSIFADHPTSSITGVGITAHKIPVIIPESGHKLITETQRRFSLINRDYPSAQKFQQSNGVQKNRVLRESVVLDPNGIKCEQVCDADGPGFGLLGFCTPYFCKCEVWDWKSQELQCASHEVFDPVSLTCREPHETILCADLPDAHQGHDYGYNSLDSEWVSSEEPVRTSYEIRTGWHF